MDLSRYLGLFLSETRDHLAACDHIVGTAERAAEFSTEDLGALFRHVHSIKGMASTMGYAGLASLSHALEDRLDALRGDRREPFPADGPDVLHASFACMRRMVDAVAAGRDPDDAMAAPLASRLRGTSAVDEPPGGARAPARDATPDDGVRLGLEIAFGETGDGTRATLRLIRAIGGLGRVERIHPPVVLRTGHDDSTRRLSAIVRTTRCPDTIRREIASLPCVVDVDVTALARGPTPPARGPSTPAAHLRIRADVADDLLAAASELAVAQDGLLGSLVTDADPETRREASRCQALARRLLAAASEIRLVPFETVTPRLTAGIEDVAARLGKRVRVTVEGGDVRIDRSSLEALVDPLMHVARNAVTHGIETERERIAAGKPDTGRIRLAVVRTRDRIRIEIEDDGRGMDPEAIRRAAVRCGAVSEAECLALADDQVLQLVTHPGVTTAAAGGPLAGRGVGMDVVERAAVELGGRLRIRSERDRGSTFVLDLPQSQAVIQALLCRASGALYAVPLDAVLRTVGLAGATLQGSGARVELIEPDRAWVLRPLAERIGSTGPADRDSGSSAALILRNDAGATATVVEEVLGRRDILVRPLEAPLRALPWFTGSTLLDDGAVALVIDPEALV